MSSNTDTSHPVSVTVDLRLASYRGGGIARYGTQLYDALQHEPNIALSALLARSDTSARQRGVRVWTPPHHRLERYSLPAEITVRRAVPRVFHAIDFIAPRLSRASVVATVHDLAFRHWPSDLAPDALHYYQQLERSSRWTDAWITPSAWTADELAQMYSIERERIHVVPHGDSLGLIGTAPLLLAERGRFILAVSTVEPRKCYDLLLDAWALARARDDVELVVVGRPGWQSTATQARLSRTERVRWLQNVDDTLLRTLYREALAVVIPSRAEGFGLAALEAMASGTPVLSSGGGALPEVTGTDALTVAASSAEAWSEAIDLIVADRDIWERLSRAGIRRASAFSWQRSAAASAAIYLTLSAK